MSNRLKPTKDQVSLCDPAGLAVGRVVPLSSYGEVVVPFTEEELRQAEAETEEFTLDEILAGLGKQ